MFTRKNLLTALALTTFSCASNSTLARNKFSDPGILLSSKTVKGRTIERYSDGLTAEYTLRGYRKERSDDETVDAEMTTTGDAASWVKEFMDFPDFSASPNNAGLQSRLR